MLFSLFLKTHTHPIRCMHDEAQKNIQVVQETVPNYRQSLDGENSGYVPLKIDFKTDRFTLSNVESSVLDTVKNFTRDFLQCKDNKPFDLVGNYSDGTKITGKSNESINLHITLENAPNSSFEAGLAASVVPVILKQDMEGRPIQGRLTLPSINYYPKEFQINLVKHAVFHILGISASMYQSFKDPTTGKNYSSDNLFCNFTKLGKNFTFLVTPGAHMVAYNHFGPNPFTGDDNKVCPAGIELDSNPSYGFSHPESLIYHTDIMTAATYNPQIQIGRVTDVTIAMLNDTGFYKVNYRLGQPNIWLNTYSYDTLNHTDWAINVPEEFFPSDYFANVNASGIEALTIAMGGGMGPDQQTDVASDYQVGFDFTFAGTTKVLPFSYKVNLTDLDPNKTGIETFNLTDKVYYFKKNSTENKYYNPKPRNYMGAYQEMKFMPLLLKTIHDANPTLNCPPGQFIHPGTNKLNIGKVYQCNKVVCDFEKYSNYTYYFNQNHKFTCRAFNESVNIKDEESKETITIKCVDPGRFCRTINLTDSYFTGDPLLRSYEIDNSQAEAALKKKIAIGVAVTFVIILIVAIVAFVFIFRWIKKKQREEDMRRFKAIIAKVKATKRSQTVAETGGKEIKEPLQQHKTERTSRATSMIPRNPLDEPGQRGNLTPGQSGKTNERLQQILFLQQMDKTRDYQKVDDQKQEQPPVAEMISHGPEPGENLDEISEGTSVDNPSSENEEKAKQEEEAKPTDFDDSLIL